MKVALAAFALALTFFLIGLLIAQGTAEADDPIPQLIPPAEYQGKPAKWWANKTVHWKRAALARGRTLAIHRKVNRERVELGSANGVARGLLCIHGFEGSWQDDGAPFWGGLQMDRQFQNSYGREFVASLGTANNWPPFIQLAVAMRAYYSGRGFTPWPNTRRMCGV